MLRRSAARCQFRIRAGRDAGATAPRAPRAWQSSTSLRRSDDTMAMYWMVWNGYSIMDYNGYNDYITYYIYCIYIYLNSWGHLSISEGILCQVKGEKGALSFEGYEPKRCPGDRFVLGQWKGPNQCRLGEPRIWSWILFTHDGFKMDTCWMQQDRQISRAQRIAL